jgi:hypothetical protein
MISHRNTAVRIAVLGVLGSALSSCERGTFPTLPVASGAASFSKKPVVVGAIATRVMVNKAGLATIEFRTGAADNARNTQVPDGYFREISYSVYDVSGTKPKQILNRTISFDDDGPGVVKYAQVVPSRSGDTEIHSEWPNSDGRSWGGDNQSKSGDWNGADSHGRDGTDGHGEPDEKDADEIGTLLFKPAYRVIVQAELEGVAADPRDGVDVTDTSHVFFNPDLDLSASRVQKLAAGPPPNPVDLPAQVQIGVPQAFQVQFFNNPGAGLTVGAQVTCEVHVFAGALDVTPAIAYHWIPNSAPEFDANKAGSAASDTVTILPNNTAVCRFTMTLPTVGTYQIVAKANAIYPADFDPSNNQVSGSVTAITGTVIDPQPGGFGSNASADDYYFTGLTGVFNTPGALYTPFIGDSVQVAGIDNLSSTIVASNNGISGQFILTVGFSTIDGSPLLPTGKPRILARGIWTGSLADLVTAAAAAQAPNHCVSSDAFGVFPVFTTSTNHLEALMCVQATDATHLQVGTELRWRPSSDPPIPQSATAGAQYFGDYLIWDTDLKFTTISLNPVSHAPVKLGGGTTGFTQDILLCPTDPSAVGCAFSATAKVRVHRIL